MFRSIYILYIYIYVCICEGVAVPPCNQWLKQSTPYEGTFINFGPGDRGIGNPGSMDQPTYIPMDPWDWYI